jgi:hypothetical protein
MKPAQLLYWIRAGLGVTAGAISAMSDFARGVLSRAVSMDDFFFGLSVALLFFIVTYYILKVFFIGKFEKRSKILSTGIGAYFFLWLVMWVLLDSIIKGPL